MQAPYLPLHMTPSLYRGRARGQDRAVGAGLTGTLRCPLLPLQPRWCWGRFSHRVGAQPSLVTRCCPCAPAARALSPPPNSPEPQLSPALPSVPGRADCYSSCIPSPQASGFLKKPTALFSHTLPLTRLVAQPCPCRAGSCLRPLPRDGVCREGTEPCQRSARRATGFLCLSVWLSQSPPVPSGGAEHPWVPL